VIKVKIYSILGIKEVIGQREVEIELSENSSLSDLISKMVEKWGNDLASRLLEPGSNKMLSYIRVMVNGKDIAFLDGFESILSDGDEVIIFPPVSGG
jgi:molybdopterin synthase sulfur carrier subunit